MLLFSTLLTAQRFPHAFATRTTKDAELQRVLGTTEVIQSKQVHGSRVVEADAPPGTEADAIVARSTRAAPQAIIAVGVRVADCVPVLIAAAKSGDVAAVHAGWRGVVAEVVPAAVKALGGGPVFAAIGPCIGACCFEVGSDVAARIAGTCKEKRVVVWE
ncbi:MAG: polyphenol oxidase family protein, partial [Myxococcota bacterium]|nr:polyphenol oxidase family protein [Myxococcota bacterium]